MSITAQELFKGTVSNMLPNEQLRLATLILQALTQSDISMIDISDTWNEQDQKDLTNFSFQYAAHLYPEDKNLV
jgi:hypothetical protein